MRSSQLPTHRAGAMKRPGEFTEAELQGLGRVKLRRTLITCDPSQKTAAVFAKTAFELKHFLLLGRWPPEEGPEEPVVPAILGVVALVIFDSGFSSDTAEFMLSLSHLPVEGQVLSELLVGRYAPFNGDWGGAQRGDLHSAGPRHPQAEGGMRCRSEHRTTG